MPGETNRHKNWGKRKIEGEFYITNGQFGSKSKEGKTGVGKDAREASKWIRCSQVNKSN